MGLLSEHFATKVIVLLLCSLQCHLVQQMLAVHAAVLRVAEQKLLLAAALHRMGAADCLKGWL